MGITGDETLLEIRKTILSGPDNLLGKALSIHYFTIQFIHPGAVNA